MSSVNPLFAQLDTNSKQLGENGHIEHGWQKSIDNIKKCEELLTQVYFQLVRAKSQLETNTLRENIDNLIKSCIQTDMTAFNTTPYYYLLMNLYKLIGHTRDIEYKGERELAYAQVWVWYKYFPELAYHAVRSFVHYIDEDGTYNLSKHQYGSWNDIKYFCGAIKSLDNNRENHPLINLAVNLISQQLQTDKFTGEDEPISLAARHAPREKGRFGWLFKKIAVEMYPYETTAVTSTSKERALRKAYTHLRKNFLAPLNKQLDTVQIKMAAGTKGEGLWDQIDFNTVTSKTMRQHSKAWQNITKVPGEQRSQEEHRINCASNFKLHIEKALSGDKSVKVHGKRCNTYELVRDAIAATTNCTTTEKERVNLQWKSNSENNKGLGNMIAICDVSGSMTCDNAIPLYNAIGLGIRISEKAAPAFQNRVITFSENPSWINLSDCTTFCDKVSTVRASQWGITTNIYKAFQLILNGILESEMSPVNVENMILIVFSDMQINQGSDVTNDSNTLYDNIKSMFSNAGIRSKYNAPYPAPHLVWWNLRTTTGFPTVSSTENCTMLSGYNASLLNAFESKGVDALKEYTPYRMINDILNEERYNMMERKFVSKFE